MNIEDISFAIDSIKDRLCSLESVENKLDNSYKKEILESLSNAESIHRRAITLVQKIEKKEIEFNNKINMLNDAQLRIHKALEYWAKYFSMRPNINFRQNTEDIVDIETKFTKISNDLTEG